MKKFVAVLSAAAMMTSLAACGSTADTANTAASSANTAASAAKSTADTAAADSYKVAIVQQLDHASLDEIRVAIEKELDAKPPRRASQSSTRTSTAERRHNAEPDRHRSRRRRL